MNKQEKNIVDILTFDEIEDVVDIFIDKVYHTDKTVALITDKELVEYAMEELLDDSFITVKRVDLELDSEDAEYMISVNDDGNIVVQPIEYYDNKYFKGIEYAFVDMDGCISQITIDALLDRNVPVVLFGLNDNYDCSEYEDDEGYTINGKPVSKDEFDTYVSHFRKVDEKSATTSTTTLKSTYKVNGKKVSKEEFDKQYKEFEDIYLDNIRDILLGYCEFMDCLNDWRSRIF